MRNLCPLILAFCLALTSCDSDDIDSCAVTATVVTFGDGSCGYYFFRTSTGMNLHPDQDAIQQWDTTFNDISLIEGSVVQLGYREKDSFEFRCLALLVDTNPIVVTCLSQGDESVILE